MLINGLFDSQKNFRRRVQLRAWTAAWLLLAGALLLGVSFWLAADGQNAFDGYARGFYPGAAAGLLAAGGGLLWRSLAMLKDPRRLEKAQLVENDERVLWVRCQALTVCAYFMAVALYAGAIATALVWPVVSQTLVAVLCLFLALLFAVNRWLLAR